MSDFETVNAKFKAVLARIGGEQTERSITQMLIQAGSYSAELTPIATSFLINSQFREVYREDGSWVGELGYGAEYAAFVHDKPGTLLGSGVLRSPSRDGVVWGPNAEPEFLSKGVRKMLENDARGIIRGTYG